MSLRLFHEKKAKHTQPKIRPQFNDLRAKRTTDEFQIPDECSRMAAESNPYGTRVILSELLHEPTKNKPETCPERSATIMF